MHELKGMGRRGGKRTKSVDTSLLLASLASAMQLSDHNNLKTSKAIQSILKPRTCHQHDQTIKVGFQNGCNLFRVLDASQIPT